MIMTMTTTTALAASVTGPAAGSVTGRAGTLTGHPATEMMRRRKIVTARMMMRTRMKMKMKMMVMMVKRKRKRRGARWPRNYLNLKWKSLRLCLHGSGSKCIRCENRTGLAFCLHGKRSWRPFLEGPETFSGRSYDKNLKPYVYRAVLFTQF